MTAARRTALRLIAGALMVPALAASPLRALAQATPFAPPLQPMLYVRRLERGMAGGHRFVVERRFAVHFHALAGGYRVDGAQVGVDVEAPEAIAEFARIERERVEQGLFPLTLNDAGIIVDRPPVPLAERLDEAVRLALGQLRAQGHAARERTELEQFVLAVQQGAARLVSELPRDLFAPGAPRRETRDVALPGGDAGAVTVAFTAVRDPATGLMREAQRVVTTDLHGAQRQTRESWTLTPHMA
jgi:hypothetical protein